MRPALVVTIAYLLGSVPFGYLIVRLTQDADIRETGSGGTGATNVSRRAGKVAGVVTLVLDALKGAAAVVVARLLLENASTPETTGWWIAAAAIAVIVGHMFPVWLSFRGGKGVATGVGVFLVLAPWAVAVAAVVFLLIVWRTRYVSLGSIVAAACVPLAVLVYGMLVQTGGPSMPVLISTTIGGALIVFAHRANIRRLVEGNESKFR
ncbi:MAG TPA: glycerol-3-phosphate 1-O-acyltransferase PlsY [Pyrinomonadaceae bacterium]|nr:glycerol-3-phosphate 1-O-acyltransferase PlsY [Pyrinomonadaceae bacterium]